MARRRGEIGKRRREQIVEAAVTIIAEEGLQHLSLSAIENRTDMSRGQLTYYYRTKEDILLAVFDHMIATMHSRTQADEGPPGCPVTGLQGWERVKSFLNFMVLHPPDVPEFHALQYTFLSQIGHRDDFRERLAQLYELWRSHLASDLVVDLPSTTESVSARTLATFIQAILHGLAIQRAADPDAYDRQEMATLCKQMIATYLQQPETTKNPPQRQRARRQRTKESKHERK